MPAQMLQSLKQIADYLGLQDVVDAKRLVLSWIVREGLPAKRVARHWCADAHEVEQWWASRRAERPADDLAKSRGQT